MRFASVAIHLPKVLLIVAMGLLAHLPAYGSKQAPTAAQRLALARYDHEVEAANLRFETEMKQRFPDLQALEAARNGLELEETVLLRNEILALLQTINAEDPIRAGQQRLAERWFDKTGRGYWAMIRAAQLEIAGDSVQANRWFTRALAVGFVSHELRELPKFFLQGAQAWIDADFPKLNDEFRHFGRGSSAGMVAAHMLPYALFPVETTWRETMDALCIDAEKHEPIDDEDARALTERVHLCKQARSTLIAQYARRMDEYGAHLDIPAGISDGHYDFDNELFAPLAVIECEPVSVVDYVHHVVELVQHAESRELGAYLRRLQAQCEGN